MMIRVKMHWRSKVARLAVVGLALVCVAAAKPGEAQITPPPPMTLYRANLHCHTGWSDGYWLFWPEGENPSTAYAYAYANGLDSLAVTDHGEMLNLTEWQGSIDAALNASASYWPFVAVHGFEWTGTYYIPDTGHISVLGSTTRVGAYKTGQNTEADVFGSLGAFYGWLGQQAVPVDRQRSGALTPIGQFNHPTADDGSDHFNGLAMPADPKVREAMALFEMGSWVQNPNNPLSIVYEGMATQNDSFDPRWSAEHWYRIALQQGWRVAPSNNGDNHLGGYVWHHGFGPPTCTGVYMPAPPVSGTSLQRQSRLLDALRSRRTIAAEDRNADVLVTADAGASFAPWWMGTACAPPPGGSITIRVQASDPTDTISKVQLLCPDGTIVAEWSGLSTNALDRTVVLTDADLAALPITAAGEICIYAKVTETDGHLLFAAPLWISRTAHQAVMPDVAVFGSVGPVTFSADLVLADTAAPLVGKKVGFYVDGVPVGTSLTDAAGRASLDWSVPSAQTYTLTAEFTGDGDAAGCWTSRTIDSSTFTSLTTIDRSGTVTQAITLRGYLKRVSDNSWCVGKEVRFKIDGTDVGFGLTDANGHAAYVWTITAGPATRTIAAEFAGDAGLSSSRGLATLTAIVWSTKMVAFDRTQKITGKTELKARLLRSDNAPLYNRPINFYVDGTFVITRPTNVDGYASYPYYTVPDGAGAGTRTILAEWIGNDGYLPASKTATLTVQKATPYIWVMPRSVPQGGVARLYAYFRRLIDYQKQEGKTVSFKVDGTWIADVVTLSGADAGIARYSYTTVEAPGAHTMRCEFAGDAWVEAGYGEATLTIY